MKILVTFLVLAALLAPPARITDEKSLTIAAAGDNLIHSGIFRDAKTANGYDFSKIYARVAGIVGGADVAFVNQETPLVTDNFSGYPKFRSPSEVGDALVGAGFDVINIANNHMLDAGDSGLAQTRDYLLSKAEAVCGYDSSHIAVIERKGIRIAFVGFTYSTNCDGYSDVPRLSEPLVRKLIGKAKAMADVVVCSVHWGDEYDSGAYRAKFEVSEKQKYYAELMAECGADLILGTHPHVLQDITWIKREDGGRTLCVYSLGNFLSNMRYGAQMLGGIFYARIVKNERGVFICSPVIIPTVCHFSEAHKGYVIYPLSEYSDGLAAVHGTQDEKNELPFCIKTLTLYYENNIPAEFRTEKYKEGIANDKP